MKIQYEKVEPASSDERRTLIPVFNGDFLAKQVKVLSIKKNSVLGNHYHEYSELFYLLEGRANYTFEDVDTKERRSIEMKKGERIRISPRIAHKAEFLEDTVMIEGTEAEYISREANDRIYKII